MPLAFLTGGGSAIGEGIACCLAARGFTVAVSDIKLDLARRVAVRAGGGAEALELDATDRTRIDAAVKDLIARHGHIDALVNVAGGMRGLGIAKANFADMTPTIWNRILTANLQSVLHCCHAVLPSMIAAKRGSIVSIAASRGLRGGAQASIYSAAKAAIIVFSQSLAQEVGPHSIRVNTVGPTFLETALTKPFFDNAAFKAEVLAKIKLGRLGTVEDVLGAILFLASEASALVTGASLRVDGGWTAE